MSLHLFDSEISREALIKLRLKIMNREIARCKKAVRKLCILKRSYEKELRSFIREDSDVGDNDKKNN